MRRRDERRLLFFIIITVLRFFTLVAWGKSHSRGEKKKEKGRLGRYKYLENALMVSRYTRACKMKLCFQNKDMDHPFMTEPGLGFLIFILLSFNCSRLPFLSPLASPVGLSGRANRAEEKINKYIVLYTSCHVVSIIIIAVGHSSGSLLSLLSSLSLAQGPKSPALFFLHSTYTAEPYGRIVVRWKKKGSFMISSFIPEHDNKQMKERYVC